MKTKLGQVAFIIAASLVMPIAMRAQQPVKAFHRVEGAMISTPAATAKTPQLAGRWDILSTDASGDTYNTGSGYYLGPIEFTADFTQNGSTLTEVPGYTFTSSSCSADGTASITAAINPDGASGNGKIQFVATVDNGYTYTFSGNYNSKDLSKISGTWTSSPGACGINNGTFTAYQYSQLTNNSYVGEFTSDVNNTQVKNVTVNLKEASDFSASGTINGPGNSCFNGLTIDHTQSFVSGGLVEFYATNSQGAVVAFIASNTDENYKQLPNDQPNESSLYITYGVYQSGGYCVAGDSGHDAVFNLKQAPTAVIKLPVIPMRGRLLRDPNN
ncbi:MAG: hypothetical protein WBP79_14685 [Candidatus Acidiferrales bacterium]